jgi:photosystem II stability/assembly factor-like uncharacterized protein
MGVNRGPGRFDPAPAWRVQAALAVVPLAAAVAGLCLSACGRAQQAPGSARIASSTTPSPIPTEHPVAIAPTPVPWTVPGTIAYVVPSSISFPSAADGWVLGRACDAQQECEVGVARTTDAGATWEMAAPPVDPNPTDAEVQLAAASSQDAWVWGTDSDGDAVLAATHDGGESWQPADLAGEVVEMAVEGQSVWALSACTEGPAESCPLTLSSSPVAGGPWSAMAPLPAAVSGAPISNTTLAGPKLMGSEGRVWLLNDNQSEPGLATTDDGGRSWAVLPLPCSAYARMSLAASSSDDLLLACTDMGVWPAPQEVWASDDGGGRWSLRSREWCSALTPPLSDVGSIGNGGAPVALTLSSGSAAWMVNDREDDLVSHDDGVTWSPAALPASAGWSGAGGGEGLTFADPLHGWTYNSAGLWATTDGGSGWHYQPVIGPVPGWPSSS